MAIDPAYAVISWPVDWSTADDAGSAYRFRLALAAGGVTEYINVPMSGDAHGFANDADGGASIGSLADMLGDCVMDAVNASGGSYAIAGYEASYVTGHGRAFVGMRIDFEFSAAPTSAMIIELTDSPLTAIGVRTFAGSWQLQDMGGGVWRLESNGNARGWWTPYTGGTVDDDAVAYMTLRHRGEFDENNYTSVTLSQRRYSDLTWRNVTGFYITARRHAHPAYIAQAGIESPTANLGGSVLHMAKDEGNTLEAFCDQIALVNPTFRVYTGPGDYRAFQVYEDQDISTAAFATPASTGGMFSNVLINAIQVVE